MKKSQWITFGIVLSILFAFFMYMASTWNLTCSALSLTSTDSPAYTSCVIKAQSYAIPGIISFFLAVAFYICARLEGKK